MPQIIAALIVIILIILLVSVGVAWIAILTGLGVVTIGDLWARPMVLLGCPPSLAWGLMGLIWGAVWGADRALRELRATSSRKNLWVFALTFWCVLWLLSL